MKKLLVVLVAAAALLAPAAASAHPLGNFTINRFARVEVAGHRLYVRYVLDMAEIPTYQARQDGVDAASMRGALARGLHVTVDGRPVALQPTARALAFPRGVAGLHTMRLEVILRGPTVDGTESARRARHELRRPHRLEGDRRRRDARTASPTSCTRTRRACSQSPLDVTRVRGDLAPTDAPVPQLSAGALRSRRPTASPTPASPS